MPEKSIPRHVHDDSRVAKFLRIFGFGSSTPYNAPSLIMPGPFQNAGSDEGKSWHTWYAGQMQQGENYTQQLGNWKEMMEFGPIKLAVKIIIEECMQTEHSCPGILWVEGGDNEVEEMLNDLITDKLKMEEKIRGQFANVISMGNHVERLHLGPEGVHGWHPRELEKIERFEDMNRRLIGFKDEDEKVQEGEPCVIWGAENDKKRLHKPWDFAHARLMQNNLMTAYGTSILEPAVQVYKQLRMCIDQMVTMRMNLQPSRYVIKIDVGGAGVPDTWKIVNQWMSRMRATRLLDIKAGIYEKRYNPWEIDAILYLPLRGESKTDVTKLQGDTQVPDIFDIQDLRCELAAELNIPPEYMGVSIEGNNQGLSPKSSLALQDLRFQRSIKTIRASVMQMYDLVCRLHLALLDKDPFVPFKIKMSNINALEAESQLELVNAQADLADKLIALGANIQAPTEEWLRLIFTKYFPLPPELVDIFAIGSLIKPQNPEGEAGAFGGGPGGDLAGPLGGEEMPPLGGEAGNAPPEGGGPPGPFGGEEPPQAPAQETREINPVQYKQQLAEWRPKYRKWYNNYFAPKKSVERYKARYGKELCESMQINEVKGLLKLREQIEQKLESITDHKQFKNPIRRLIHQTQGYSPNFAFFEDFASYIKKDSKVQTSKQLFESMWSETPKTEKKDEHDILRYKKNKLNS